MLPTLASPSVYIRKLTAAALIPSFPPKRILERTRDEPKLMFCKFR